MEWLETDGLGGFAMGTAVGMPMRRYHALLNVAHGSPANRICLVNAVEAWLIVKDQRIPLSSFSFGPENIHPQGLQYIKSFSYIPFPTWIFNIKGIEVQHELFQVRNSPLVALSWKIQGIDCEFEVRPFISGRSYHALHKQNNEIDLQWHSTSNGLKWLPYKNVPAIFAYSNASFSENRLWFNNVNYEEDRKRGATYQEDWASPGIFRFSLNKINGFEAVLIFSSEALNINKDIVHTYHTLRKDEELRRSKFNTQLSRAADAYIVKRGEGKTIIAGYPWFADWGRDTFISMRGLCLANDRLDDAKSILTEWSKAVKDGMLPNRFVEEGEEPEYNSVDSALWFIIACFEYIKSDRKSAAIFTPVIENIIESYIKGTAYSIGLDQEDGLLRAGIPGVQLTWMDAKIGNYVVTPRIGKPVEIQALWLNALKISSLLSHKHLEVFHNGLKSFQSKFWNAAAGCLFDVVDCDHEKGKNDGAIRPNQVLCVGGLPFPVIDGDRAFQVINCVEKELFTPPAIRTLSPRDPNYRGHYTGDGYQRDSAYHQGTAWPWLMGPFIEAWVRVHGDNKTAKKEAIRKFYVHFIENLNSAGLGHLSEIHDADAPYNSRGCPFQAWSVGEALRLEKQVLT